MGATRARRLGLCAAVAMLLPTCLEPTSVRVEVSATLNGGPFDASIYQSGLIWGGIGPDDLVELTRTNVATPDIILLSGDYTFYYQHQNGDQVPANVWSRVGQQSIDAPPE